MESWKIKFGNVVELENGERYFVTYIKNDICYICLNVKNDNFKNLILKNDTCLNNVIKIYEDYTCTRLIWERIEIPKLSKIDIKQLEIFKELGFTHIKRDVVKDTWLSNDENGYNLWTTLYRKMFNTLENDVTYLINDLLKGNE